MTRYSLLALLVGMSLLPAAPVTVVVDTPMPAPAWARLERQILADKRPGLPGVLREVLRRARLSPGLPALGRERRARRCVRELQSLAGAACARRQTTRSSSSTSRPGGHDPPVLRSEDDRRAGRPGRHVRERVLRAIRLDAPRRGPATLQPHGALGAEPARVSRSCRGASRDSTWARIRPRRTTTRRRS